MSDRRLRELERAARGGDTEAAGRLQVEACRRGEHLQSFVGWGGDRVRDGYVHATCPACGARTERFSTPLVAFALWIQSSLECERFDSLHCSGVRRGVAMPMTAEERRVCIQHARDNRRRTTLTSIAMGLSERESEGARMEAEARPELETLAGLERVASGTPFTVRIKPPEPPRQSALQPQWAWALRSSPRA